MNCVEELRNQDTKRIIYFHSWFVEAVERETKSERVKRLRERLGRREKTEKLEIENDPIGANVQVIVRFALLFIACC
jgi:hypothetical protein